MTQFFCPIGLNFPQLANMHLAGVHLDACSYSCVLLGWVNGSDGSWLMVLICSGILPVSTVGSPWAPKVCQVGQPKEDPWISQGKDQGPVRGTSNQSQGLNPSDLREDLIQQKTVELNSFHWNNKDRGTEPRAGLECLKAVIHRRWELPSVRVLVTEAVVHRSDGGNAHLLAGLSRSLEPVDSPGSQERSLKSPTN